MDGKEKIQSLIASLRTNPSESERIGLNLDSVAKIVKDFVNPSIEEENSDIRYQFMGERGATEADRAEEATTRLDNLKVAREMEAAKKDAKAIKLATGWERGADGKWRYEIPDGRCMLGGYTSYEWRIYSNQMLTDALANDALYKAYPELKQVRVEIDDDMPRNMYGRYVAIPGSPVIFINEKMGWRERRDALLHEVQHAIQDIEGFDTGGNANILAEQNKGRITELNQLKAEIEEEIARGDNSREEELQEIELELQDYDEDFGGYDYYHRIAGEVEARNVERRSDMTANERRKTLAAETEDVAREDQVFLNDSLNGVSESSTKEEVLYRIRENEPPKKTGIGYKVFVLKDGKLYPPMVANPGGAETPVGVWLDADAAPISGQSKTGRNQVKAGGKGTQGGSGQLAYRPGWHLGEIPYALQFNRTDTEGNRTLFPKNLVLPLNA